MEAKYQTKLILTILSILILNCDLLIATVRYVSTTGSSTPPYTTWETAADSIQKCIDFSFAEDTIIVANGIYYESLVVDKYLWLIGSSMDSTIIDGTGLANTTVSVQADLNIEGFNIIGKERADSRYIIGNLYYNTNIKNCRMKHTGICIFYGNASGRIENVILTDCTTGFNSFCAPDTCYPIVTNSIIIIDASGGFPTAINIFDGGNPVITNNILIGSSGATYGIGISLIAKTIIIKNNFVSGFSIKNIESSTTDTAIIHNNISSYSDNFGYRINAQGNMRNNISIHNNVGVDGPTNTNSDYNLYWQNNTNTTDGLSEHDIIADPMFVKDTIPVYGGSFDYHLQAYSPAIDAGDPNILDVDGSRSDIGVYGGPNGEEYTYLDLAPRSPVNLSAEVDSLEITLTWNKNTEADFSYYNIYRDTVSGFTIDSTKLISSQTDTFYIQLIPSGITRLVYKITAVDNQGNSSGPSEEVIVNITTIEEYPVVISAYKLYQNYPNPFNPSTKIGYRLKKRGYVKLMVYDIKGELIDVLVNKVKEAGYYEVEFTKDSTNNIASGIYLYRIEVIGDGRIPVYSDMKKMILLK